MKKLILLAIIAFAMVCAKTAKAQNIQLFYDAGRNCATTTVEMFRPDKGGSTYFFVDMDYAPRVFGAYWEIAREFNFWQDTKMGWLSAHIEYNGGLNVTDKSFNNSILVGPTYSGHAKDFSITWSLSALYKIMPGLLGLDGNPQIHGFQITGVWGINFLKGWCTFSGFFDFSKEAKIWLGTNYTFISEPQFWVNLNKIKGWDKVHLSLGGEVELSNNFIKKGFCAYPAVGAKWTF